MSTKVKGAILQSRKAYVLQEHGEEAWRRVVAALPEGDRETLSGLVLTATWYPFELNERLDQAIVEVVGGGDASVFEAMGARSARANLEGSHSVVLTPGDPGRFLSLTDRIYSFYYDTGHREYEPTGDSSGVIVTRGSETHSTTDCLTVIGWYKEALRMCGAGDVEMTETECRATGGEVCRYEVSWQMPEAAG